MARATAGGNGTRTALVPLPHTRSTPVVVLFAEVGDVGAGGFEDPQAQQAGHGYQGKVAGIGRLPGCG